jgi:hypothetical protein
MCIHPSCNCFAPFSHISSRFSDNADCIVLCNRVTNFAMVFACQPRECLAAVNSTHDSQQSHADQQMFLFFDEHGPYQAYPESQSCKSRPVTILGQSMNPHAEVSGEETKLQRQEETWKVASEDLQHDRTSQTC